MCYYLNVQFQGQRVKAGKWPVSKSGLTKGNLKLFISYINSMDLEKINHCNEQM